MVVSFRRLGMLVVVSFRRLGMLVVVSFRVFGNTSVVINSMIIKMLMLCYIRNMICETI